MLRTLLIAGLLAGGGCAGDILGMGGDDDDDDDVPPEEASLRFVSPAEGSAHAREVRGDLGALVAVVDLSVETGGPIVRVVLRGAGGVQIGELVADETGADVEFGARGYQTVTAAGFDADGAELVSASVSFHVTDPQVEDCYAWLDLYGLQYERGPDAEGVPDPVTLTTPINGMPWRYVSNDAPRSTFFMDCALALSLARAAPILRAHDIAEVADIGVYNYRCIGEGTPPDCPSGMSQHAYARAIDIAGWTTGVGDYHSVNDDWVIDPDTEPTCSAATENEKDRLLHEVICEIKEAKVWNIVLTPNYNSAHRDHFHVDLTPGSDFIRSTSSNQVDVGPDDY